MHESWTILGGQKETFPKTIQKLNPMQNCASLRSASPQRHSSILPPGPLRGDEEQARFRVSGQQTTSMADDLLDVSRGAQTRRLCDGLRVPAYVAAEERMLAPHEWGPDAADEWLAAFERFRSRIAASIRFRSNPLSLDLGRKANIMKAILQTPTPDPSGVGKLAWEHRFQAMFQQAEAYAETYVSAEAACALSTKLLHAAMA